MNIKNLAFLILLIGLPAVVMLSGCTGSENTSGSNNYVNTTATPVPGIHLIKLDPAIEKSSIYATVFLVVNDNRKQEWINWIYNNSTVSQQEKEENVQYMKHLWAKYPIKSAEIGNNTTLVSFDLENKDVKLTDQENARIKEIFDPLTTAWTS
ncbi:MAG TPA: hypothetical protein VGJ92_03340 [Methanocella sp.]